MMKILDLCFAHHLCIIFNCMHLEKVRVVNRVHFAKGWYNSKKYIQHVVFHSNVLRVFSRYEETTQRGGMINAVVVVVVVVVPT